MLKKTVLFLLLTIITSFSLAEAVNVDWICFKGSFNRIGSGDFDGPYTKELNIFWQKNTNASIASSIVASDNKVIVVSYNDYAHQNDRNFVYCMNADNGEKIWEFETDKPTNKSINPKLPNEFFIQGVYGTPLIYENKVLFGTLNGTFYCLDLQSGEKVWSIRRGYKVLDPTQLYGGIIHSSPIIIKEFVCFSIVFPKKVTKQGRIEFSPQMEACLVDYKSGELVKSTIIDNNYSDKIISLSLIKSHPATEENKLFISSYGYIYCFDIEEFSKPLWKLYTGDYPLASSPCIVGKKLFYGTYSNDFFCVDANDGEIIWKSQEKLNIRSNTCPCYFEGMVFITTINKELCCLSGTDGSLLWRKIYNESDLSCSPVITNRLLFMGCDLGELLCIDPMNGELIYSIDTKSRMESSPSFYKGRIYVGNDFGEIICLSEKINDIKIDLPKILTVGSNYLLKIVFSNSKGENVCCHYTLYTENPDLIRIRDGNEITALKPGNAKIIIQTDSLSREVIVECQMPPF